MQARARTILTGIGITGVLSSIMIWGYRQWKLQGDKIYNPYDNPYLKPIEKEKNSNKNFFNPWFVNPFDFSITKKYVPQNQISDQEKLPEPNIVSTKYSIHPAYFTSKPAFAMILMWRDLQRQKKQQEILEAKTSSAIWQQLKLFFNPRREVESLPKNKNISAGQNNELVQATPEKDKIKSDIISKSAIPLIALAKKPDFVFVSTFTKTLVDALKKNHRLSRHLYPIGFLATPYPIICMKNISFKIWHDLRKQAEPKKIKAQYQEVKKENKLDVTLFRTTPLFIANSIVKDDPQNEIKTVPPAAVKNNLSEDSLQHSQSDQHKTKAPFKLFHHHHKPKRANVVDLHKEAKQNCCIII